MHGVFLVEDNAGDVYLFRGVLEEQGLNLRLSVAENGEEAILMMDQIDSTTAPCPELIVVDLNLPRRSGLEVLSRIRISPKCAHVPVVVWSSSEVEREKAVALGATLFLKKPSGLQEYLSVGEQFKSLLRRTRCHPVNPPESF